MSFQKENGFPKASNIKKLMKGKSFSKALAKKKTGYFNSDGTRMKDQLLGEMEHDVQTKGHWIKK